MHFFAFLFVFLFFRDQGYGAVVWTGEYAKCKTDLRAWSHESLQELDFEKHDLKELLYFLHIPRTGGRTYNHCLLRYLYPKEQHCDSSYDKLRFNSSTHCRLLATHDDYSVLRKLPAVSTSVVTNLRHPVDRIFSSYEFSIEVAARFLLQKAGPKLKNKQNAKPSKAKGVSTLDIWPWSLLVPWMREDIFRREKARQLGLSLSPGEFSHYNASAFTMPLHEFVHQPIAKELLHNGGVFQIAGLTNNSYLKGAGDLRKCVIDYPDLGVIVLNVAKRRVDNMIFVGFTEKHDESAKLFAHIVGGQILPIGSPSKMASEHDNSKTQQDAASQSSISPSTGNLTVYGLIEKYENCASRLHNTQVERRGASLTALPINFSLEGRREVAEETLEAIRLMNSLDLELYDHAQNIFYRYHQILDVKRHSSETIIDEGLRKAYLEWFSSKKISIFLTILCIGGGVLIVCIGLVVLKGRRAPRRCQLKEHGGGVHKKI